MLGLQPLTQLLQCQVVRGCNLIGQNLFHASELARHVVALRSGRVLTEPTAPRASPRHI